MCLGAGTSRTPHASRYAGGPFFAVIAVGAVAEGAFNAQCDARLTLTDQADGLPRPLPVVTSRLYGIGWSFLFGG